MTPQQGGSDHGESLGEMRGQIKADHDEILRLRDRLQDISDALQLVSGRLERREMMMERIEKLVPMLERLADAAPKMIAMTAAVESGKTWLPVLAKFGGWVLGVASFVTLALTWLQGHYKPAVVILLLVVGGGVAPS